jgi:hypothetical protein
MDKTNYIKLKNCCLIKDSTIKMKKYNKEKIFKTHIIDKGVISKYMTNAFNQ